MSAIASAATRIPGTSPQRVQELIRGLQALSETGSGPGVTRLAFTPLERSAHRVFAERMRSLGLTVRVDAIGNTIATRDGTDDLPAIGTGSHLDSVPNAGAFDGIAGVVAAMEVARVLVEGEVPHRHPFRFVAFAGEEGARFGQACIGSRVAAGLTDEADLARLTDADGVSVAAAVKALALDAGSIQAARWRADDWSAFVELHVEQGSVLTDLQLPIGVVDVISGSTRLKLTFSGKASHTGGTPMHLRADALAAAAEAVLAAERQANGPSSHRLRMSVGRLDAYPGSITTIAGTCVLYVDIRDIDSARQRQAGNAFIAEGYEIAARRGVELDVTLLGDASPVVLSAHVQTAITETAAAMGLPYRVLYSGASHDAQMISRIVPTGMIFVPSYNHGVSHSPSELSHFDEIATGADVLARTMLTLDRD